MTTNKACRLLLVNVDTLGYGYRLYPTPCVTGRLFDDELTPGKNVRYPARELQHPYIGLDHVTGIEDIYAIGYTDKAIKEAVWGEVLIELCDNESTRGSTTLPGTSVTHKRRVEDFDRFLDELQDKYQKEIGLVNKEFIHVE